MSENENLIDLFSVIYKNRKRIIYSCLVAAVLTALVSLFLKNYYKATTIFYPASTDLAKPVPVGGAEDIRNYYGNDFDLDRLLTIANSNEVVEFLVRKYNLYNHYDIDSTAKRGPSNLKKKLKKLYTTEKSRFDAIELSVEDVDPELAAQMANAARDQINLIAQSLIKGSQYKMVTAYDKTLGKKEIDIKALSDSLARVRAKYKIYSVESQGEVFGENLTITQSNIMNTSARLQAYKDMNGPQDSIRKLQIALTGLENQYRALEKSVNLFNEGYATVLSLGLEQRKFADQLAIDKERYKQLNLTYNSPFAAIHLIQEAEVPNLKSRPKRSLYVIGITMMTGILSMLWILLSHQFKNTGWREVFRD